VSVERILEFTGCIVAQDSPTTEYRALLPSLARNAFLPFLCMPTAKKRRATGQIFPKRRIASQFRFLAELVSELPCPQDRSPNTGFNHSNATSYAKRCGRDFLGLPGKGVFYPFSPKT
jgi:hypothetical protein